MPKTKPLFRRLSAAEQPVDSVFFRKIDVRLGGELRSVGRLAPEAIWQVTQITSFDRMTNSQKPVEVVQKLSDLVTLKLLNHHLSPWMSKVQRKSFGQMSYSAIWRLK